MKSICVFCGSSVGKHPDYIARARELGGLLVKRNLSLVYGGGNIGLMREIADAVLEAGGEVTGVMPGHIAEKEIVHTGLSKLHVVDTMHERKALMAKLSDAFIAMPGGFGTIDEIFEIMTWNQLEIIHKPTGLLNINGYFDKLIAFLEHAVGERFVREEHKNNLLIHDNPAMLLDQITAHQPKKADKWIDRLKQDLI